jgi:hypothetical protein
MAAELIDPIRRAGRSGAGDDHAEEANQDEHCAHGQQRQGNKQLGVDSQEVRCLVVRTGDDREGK